MATKTLSENITQAISDFNSIKNAIIAKGVEVPSGTHTSDYATKIGQIESGGGGDLPSTYVLMKSSNNNGVIDTIVIKGLTSIPDSICYASNYDTLRRDNIKYIDFGDNVTSIGKYAFYNVQALSNITIPNTVKTIGDHSFDCNSYNCTMNINSGNSIETIGEGAFGLIVFNNLHFGDNLKTIGAYAFAGNKGFTNIKNLTISDNCKIQSIGNQAFKCQLTGEQMSNIIEHWYPKTTSDLNYDVFGNNSAYTTQPMIPSDNCGELELKFVYSKFFYVANNYNVTTLTIKNDINDILEDESNNVAPFGTNPFNGLFGLTTLKLPAVKNDDSTLTNISNSIFYNQKDRCSSSPITNLILGNYDSTENDNKWAASINISMLNNLTTTSAINILNNLAKLEEGVTKTITFNATVLTNVNNAVGGTEAIIKAQNNGWTITS